MKPRSPFGPEQWRSLLSAMQERRKSLGKVHSAPTGIAAAAKTLEIHSGDRLLMLLARAAQMDIARYRAARSDEAMSRALSRLDRRLAWMETLLDALMPAATPADEDRANGRFRPDLKYLLEDLLDQQQHLPPPKAQGLRALAQRIDQPGFGACVECRRPLSIRSLLDNPSALQCAACKLDYAEPK